MIAAAYKIDTMTFASVLPSFVLSFVLSVRNFGAKYLGNEAR